MYYMSCNINSFSSMWVGSFNFMFETRISRKTFIFEAVHKPDYPFLFECKYSHKTSDI